MYIIILYPCIFRNIILNFETNTLKTSKQSGRHCIAQVKEIFNKVKEIESSNDGSL